MRHLFGVPWWKHLGMALVSLASAYVGVLAIRFVVDLSPLVVTTSAVEMGLWYIGLWFFKDWHEFRTVAPAAIIATLVGTYLGIIIP